MDDYVSGDRRKSKNDKRDKRRFRIYKQGGTFRGTDVREGSKNK